MTSRMIGDFRVRCSAAQEENQGLPRGDLTRRIGGSAPENAGRCPDRSRSRPWTRRSRKAAICSKKSTVCVSTVNRSLLMRPHNGWWRASSAPPSVDRSGPGAVALGRRQGSAGTLGEAGRCRQAAAGPCCLIRPYRRATGHRPDTRRISSRAALPPCSKSHSKEWLCLAARRISGGGRDRAPIAVTVVAATIVPVAAAAAVVHRRGIDHGRRDIDGRGPVIDRRAARRRAPAPRGAT